MINLILGAIVVVALTTAAVAFLAWRAGVEYDNWMADMQARGIQTALEPVMHGSEVIGYTVVTERRANAR